MHIVGLTGGIASGKSTASAVFREEKLAVIDLDAIAHEVTKKVGAIHASNTPAIHCWAISHASPHVAQGRWGYRRVVSALGEAYLDKDGELDRKKIAEKASKLWANTNAIWLYTRAIPIHFNSVPVQFRGRLACCVSPIDTLLQVFSDKSVLSKLNRASHPAIVVELVLQLIRCWIALKPVVVSQLHANVFQSQRLPTKWDRGCMRICIECG